MSTFSIISLDYNPTKFSTKALLLRKDLDELFVNEGTYDSPTYVSLGAGLIIRKFTTANDTQNIIAGLSGAITVMIYSDTELMTAGGVEIIIDASVDNTLAQITGIVVDYYKPAVSVSIKSNSSFVGTAIVAVQA